jgi:putative transposase
MPNHVHGIVIIEKPYSGNLEKSIVNQNGDKLIIVETQNFASLQSSNATMQPSITTLQSSIPSLQSSLLASQPSITTSQSPNPVKQSKNQFGPQTQNLASIIRGYKTGVKKIFYD